MAENLRRNGGKSPCRWQTRADLCRHHAERAGAGGDEGGSGVGKPQQAEQHLLPRIVQTVLQRVALRADAGLGEVDEQFPQRGHIIAFFHR